MISRIKGKIIEINESNIVIETMAIGYELLMNSKDIACLEMSKEYIIYTQMDVKEDSITLIGFLDKFDKKIYNFLRNVSGIGTKTANNIIGTLGAKETVSYIKEENIKALTSVVGIGKKSASRLILELKDKFDKEFPDLFTSIDTKTKKITKLSENKTAAIEALMQLGYSNQESYYAIDSLDEDMEIEEILKAAFIKLARS